MSEINSTAVPARPCVKCGATERSKDGHCKACVRARAAAWYAANPDRAKATMVAYRAANPGKKKAADAAWRAANADRLKAIAAVWRADNADKVKANVTAWRAANPDMVKAQMAAWYAANPEAKRIYTENRRARKANAGGKLSSGLAAKLFKLQKGKCPCCNHPLGDDYHLDHIMPLIRGGSNTDGNMQLLRAICNMQKHAAHPVEFMQSRGFLL